ncbi:metallophosphoesterase [Variovorax dokdonensis]|uniref:Metallophosphoesterase n=1 Tax=Variovorax dokdonensis TaxID=344883 RepID=A0ABT7NFN9_9BURK|nr:metallophosphoesterase [Variovorax dokdonensis]MDM0046772.1 metallophosphoesterase [Variovorax dokdonensis]
MKLFAPVTLLVVLLHVVLGIRLLPGVAQLSTAWPALAVLLVVSALTMPLPLLARRQQIPRWLQWLGLVSMGWFSSLLVFSLFREVFLIGDWLWTTLAAHSPAGMQSRRVLSAGVVVMLASLVTVIGYFNARRTATVRKIDIPIARLPAGLHGFTIAQLSDIHVGPTIRVRYIERIVESVNRLGADMVAITGDLVDGSVAELGRHIAPLGKLKTRHGTFVVTGNHEYYAGAHAWIDELKRLGMTVLMNEHVVLHARNVYGAQTDEEINESALVVAGVTDFTAEHFDASHASDPHAAIQDAPPQVWTRLLLAHQPRSASVAVEAGYQLQLSGHTHGGQFFPWNFFVPLQQPFTAGLHRLQDMWIYVSRGTGYWGPPKRFGAPSEITLLRLVVLD